MIINPFALGGAVTDPLFGNVKLLLHLAGNNGSTYAADYSSAGRALSLFGNAQMDNGASTLGLGSAMLCDGNGDYLTAADSPDWAPGASVDFCWEMVVRPNGDFAANTDLLSQAVGSGLYPIRIYRASGVNGGVGVLMFDSGSTLIANTVQGSLTSNAWNHFAVLREGGNLRVKVNGAHAGSIAVSTAALFNSSGELAVGAYNPPTATNWNGRIQAVRYTLGNARYGGTGAYTGPSTPFPTS